MSSRVLVLGLWLVATTASADDPPTDVGTVRALTAADPPAASSRATTTPPYVETLLALRVAAPPPDAIRAHVPSQALRDALALARRATRFDGPPPRTRASFSSFMIRALRQRIEAVRRAEQALAEVADARHSEVETLVAASTLGYLFGDVAGDIASLPLPPELTRDATLVAAYRERIATHAIPLFARARDAFSACARQPICSAAPGIHALCDYCRSEEAAIAGALAEVPVAP